MSDDVDERPAPTPRVPRRFVSDAARWRRRSSDAPLADSQPASSTASDPIALRGRLQERLASEVVPATMASGGSVAEAVDEFVSSVLDRESLALNERERRELATDLAEEALGAGPLAVLFRDPSITDILVNGPDAVYVERFGRLERTNVRFRDAEHVARLISRFAARAGRRIDAASPMVDLRLADGSRVHATLPPVSIDGPTLSIRRFGRRRIRWSELARLGSASPAILAFLEAVVARRRSVLVSGGTGAGKSTLLAALAEAIPAGERILTIEDTAELVLDQSHVVRLETRPPNAEGQGAIGARELVRNALRMRPDRIIVGEVRAGEALDMLQAMNTGHDGSLCTLHASSPRDALSRLETLVLLAGTELPSRAIREQIVSAIDILVHVRRYEDGVRRIASVAELTGLEGTTPVLQEIFRYERGAFVAGRVEGAFVATGIVPRLAEDLRREGAPLPFSLFAREGGSR